MTNRSRFALISRGSRLNSNSSGSVFSGFSFSSATAGSGSVIVATETLSPKFCFMNSVILDFSSSGEGNGGGVGGGGFCAMCRQTSRQRGFVATLRLESDPHAWRLFRAFSCAEKVQRRASAMSVAGHRQFRMLVAPHQVQLEARRKKKNAASDQVRSFAAKRAQLTQIPPAR